MNSGRTLVNGSDLYIGNSSNGLVRLGTKADIDNCFQSVSEGKALVAAAVTDKGVQTAADATFQQIANNIASIFQLDTSDATALESQILSGCTAYVNGNKVTGTMTNRGAVSSSLKCGGSYTIPAGYHNGSGKITANSLASQTSATATAAQILQGYTAWVNGIRLTGTAKGNAVNGQIFSVSANASGEFTIPAFGTAPRTILMAHMRALREGGAAYACFIDFPTRRASNTNGYDHEDWSGTSFDSMFGTTNDWVSTTHTYNTRTFGEWYYYYENTEIIIAVLYS